MSAIDKKAVVGLAEAHDLSLVVLFGSRASGKARRESDTDIGFVSERQKTPREVAEMQLAFTDALRVPNLDLVDLRGKSPLFLKQVAERSVLLYEKRRAIFARFKIYALKLYLEAKPLYRMQRAAIARFAESV